MDKYLVKLNELSNDKYKYMRVHKVDINIEDRVVDIALLVPQEILDFKFTDKEKDEITSLTGKIIPYPFKFRIDYKKSYADKTFILNDILDYINKNFPALTSVIKESSIVININNDSIDIGITLEKTAHMYYKHSGAENKLKSFLMHRYCNPIRFEYNLIEDSKVIEEDKLSYKTSKSKSHFVSINDITKLIGKAISQEPKYIRDVNTEQDRVVVSGRIKGMYGNVKKNTDKKYYLLNIDDTTATIRALYFPRMWNVKDNDPQKILRARKEYESKIEIMDKLINDSSLGDYTVVCEGNIRLSNTGELTMFINNISHCEIDFDSIQPLITKKSVPERYNVVEPKPFIDTLPSETEVVPNYLKNNRIVVFDFETTGVNPLEDTPIELGAVSIENGIIQEQFSTFINPKREITEEITRITHISNTDVLDAPYYEDVIPDFYKFVHGAVLVAHNAEFDYAFLKNYAHKDGYIFDNERQDTLAMSRNIFKELEKHSLGSICSYLNIINEGAHRAIYDAIATARLYMILISKYS